MTPNPSKTAPWLMLVARLVLFAAFQIVIAVLLMLFGSPTAWYDSQGWWLISVLLTNIVTIAILARLQRTEGKRYRDLLNFRRASVGKDLLIAFGILLLAAPISTLPNLWLSQLLFRSSDATFPMMFRALPLWAAILGLLMPVTQALAELPTYFGYSMPRLGRSLGRPWLAWAIASFFLALQHVAAPLILDPRFLIWRLGMFLPFAFFIGLCIKLRPSLLPFLMIGHALVDLPLAIIFLGLSQ
jgi:membrane protease YdiL (CAAX protease family)